MPQITKLRLLLSSAHNPASLLLLRKPTSASFSLLFTPTKTLRPISLFTPFSSLSKKNRTHLSRPLTQRNHSSFRETGRREKAAPPMEEIGSVGFNKRRAEGNDKSDRPKKILSLKDRKLNPANTICYVQIMGTGMDTQDTSPSVLLFFDKQRFIFNAGEGLQRFCMEHKIKLSKIDHIFLSRVCSETAGGLPGLFLTLAAIGDEGMAVNVWGPSDLKYFVDAMRSFIPKACMVHTRSFGPSAGSDEGDISGSRKFSDPIVLIDDEVVKISAILLRPSLSEFDAEEGRNQFSELVVKPGDISVVYVCELPEIMGKFDPKKAVALGLRPGPKYRELQLGNSVKSDRQNIMVHPSDVLGPSVPGPIVLIVDCPTSSHLPELLSLHSLSSYYGDMSGNPPETSKAVNCIIHLSPAAVTNTKDYQNKNVEIPILKGSARIAARLNYLCPMFFPAPGFWSLQHLNGSAPVDLASCSQVPVSKLCESIPAENLLKFHLRPYAQLGLDRSGVPTTNSSSEIIEELLSEIPEIVDAAQQVNQFCHMTPMLNNNVIKEPWLSENTLPSCLEDISREDMEIVLLGTGSSQPSKYRNVSSILINLFSKGSLLFDCGEGTLDLLALGICMFSDNRFGVDGADDAVRGLRCIWISHIHADHHTGLARILALRRDLLKGVPHQPLLVIAPRRLKRYLDAYQLLENLDFQFLDCRHTTESSLEAFESDTSEMSIETNANGVGLKNQDVNSTLFAKGVPMQSHWNRPDSPVNNSVVISILRNLKEVLKEAGLEALISFPVVHCPQAFGVALKAADRLNTAGKVVPGWKIVYSGDSRPCPELVKASNGATVLIHEATFEDGMVDEAIARNHSTTKEAIEVGDSAGVYRIILTHFSQRYPKIPVFDETHMHKTCIAFDLMSVNLADLPVLPRILPYLRILFRNEMIVDESDDVVDASVSAAN
ncbi:hypothetical protein C3L33_00244, partial [Rhododendron williamsianum]